MSKKAANPSPERLRMGKRIKTLREMSNLSQGSLADMMGKVRTTMYYWEEGFTKVIREKDLKLFLKIIQNQGIQCSYDWITKGEGAAPEFKLPSPTSSVASSQDNIESSHIFKELAVFLDQSTDATYMVVPDDAMEPLFTQDEVIAGINVYGKDIESLVGMNCIVFTQSGDKYARRLLNGTLPDYYNLVPLNPATTADNPLLKDVKIVSAAAIIWTRQRQPKAEP